MTLWNFPPPLCRRLPPHAILKLRLKRHWKERNFFPIINVMTRQQVLDLYFMEARAKLIDLGAFIDRVERSKGAEDFRMKAFREALSVLSQGDAEKAKRVLLSFSDPTTEPIPVAPGKSACGAWPGTK